MTNQNIEISINNEGDVASVNITEVLYLCSKG